MRSLSCLYVCTSLFPLNSFVFYAIRVSSKENRRLILPRTPSYFFVLFPSYFFVLLFSFVFLPLFRPLSLIALLYS
jgi:hypothetical protein